MWGWFSGSSKDEAANQDTKAGGVPATLTPSENHDQALEQQDPSESVLTSPGKLFSLLDFHFQTTVGLLPFRTGNSHTTFNRFL